MRPVNLNLSESSLFIHCPWSIPEPINRFINMVQCHPLDSLSSAAGSSPYEKTPLVHPPMVCEDDCQCFKKNYFKKSYETIPALNTSGIHVDKREVGDIDLEG